MGEVAAFVTIVLALLALFAYGLAQRRRDKRPHWRVSDGKTTRALDDTDEGKLYQQIARDVCPDCGGRGFYNGPCGGMSENIFCKNRNCRSGFNVTVFDSHNGTAERIGKSDIERYPTLQ